MPARLASLGVAVGLLVGAVPSRAQARVDVVPDVRYATHAGIDLLLDVYVPPGEGPFPAVVVIPGGKWVNIDKTKHSDVPMYFADHGIAAFAITYRSALEFPYPAAVEDVRAAIRWIREHAASYGVDPRRLGAIGASAGGHLAALIGAMGAGPTDQGTRVNAVLSWSGPMDLRPLADAEDVELRQAVRTFLGCEQDGSCAHVAGEASPISYVDPTDPPMFLVNGDSEIIPVDQAERMRQALTDAGIEGQVDIVRGGHGAGYGGGEKVLDIVIPFAQAWIDGRSVPVQNDPGDTDSGDGKSEGQEAPAPTSEQSEPVSEEKPGSLGSGTAVGATTSSDRIVVAIALVASVLVVAQLIVIIGLRRRIASRSVPGDSEGAGARGR